MTDQIDCAFKFSSETAARQAAEILAGQFDVNAQAWAMDHVLPNIQVWRPSQDTQVANPTPPPATITQHTYLTGWFCIVSVLATSPVLPTLLNAASLQFAFNRTAWEGGATAAQSLVKNNIGTVINDIMFQPIYATSRSYW